MMRLHLISSQMLARSLMLRHRLCRAWVRPENEEEASCKSYGRVSDGLLYAPSTSVFGPRPLLEQPNVALCSHQ